MNTATIYEGQPLPIRQRILKSDRTILQSGDVVRIEAFLYDLTDRRGDPVQSDVITTDATVYDGLQTDSVWDRDSRGYNFKWTVDGDWFTDGARGYRLEVLIHTNSTDDGVIPFVWHVRVKPLLSV